MYFSILWQDTEGAAPMRSMLEANINPAFSRLMFEGSTSLLVN
jgi:hypothetical protein